MPGKKLKKLVEESFAKTMLEDYARIEVGLDKENNELFTNEVFFSSLMFIKRIKEGMIANGYDI